MPKKKSKVITPAEQAPSCTAFILDALKECLTICRDKSMYAKVEPKEMQALEASLTRSFLAAQNVYCRIAGMPKVKVDTEPEWKV